MVMQRRRRVTLIKSYQDRKVGGRTHFTENAPSQTFHFAQRYIIDRLLHLLYISDYPARRRHSALGTLLTHPCIPILHLLPASKAKIMSREPFRPRTPAPLKTSQTPNLHWPPPHRPYGFAPDSPTSLLAPKEGGLKIKVKAGVSPEARSRVGAGPSGSAPSALRPMTPRPVRSRLGASSPLPPLPVPSTPIASTSSAAAASRYTPAASSKLATMRRVMSASDSEQSLSAYAGETDLVAMDAAMGVEAEELHEHETVLVSVR